MNLFRDHVYFIKLYFFYLSHISVADELAILVVMSGRERHYLVCYTNHVLGFRCKNYVSFFVVSIVKRSDSYRISCGYELFLFTVIYDTGKFRIENIEHLGSEFLIQREEYLAITVALKAVSEGYQVLSQCSESI